MQVSNFNLFVSKFPNWEKDLKVYQRDDAVFKRIICRWKENKQTEHQVHACINTQTGDIYLDCRRRKIFAKNLTLLAVRPIHTLIKTIFHATIILPLALEVIDCAKGKQNYHNALKHTYRSLLDIVRTPIYGTAMTISHLGALTLGIILPNSLYRTREFIGKLERDMLWNERSKWVLSPCFSPIKNVSKSSDKKSVLMREVKSKLKKFAQDNVEFRRENRALFNDCYVLFPEDKQYISAAAP